MKTKIKIFSLFLMFYIGSCIIPQRTSAQQLSVNFQVFYDELSPYGTWIENPEYGYVWIPDVDPGFTPYATNGYWVFTDDGWTWVSNYSWGWAPFHYGRWYTDPYYGPMWIPDNEWGPGWVTWRRSADYYGWAPMGPGISISIAYGNGYNERYNNYTFVRGRHFGSRDMNNYYINTSNNITIINNTTVINNTRINRGRNVTYNAGPDRLEVERRVGKRINQVSIRESNKPGQNIRNNELQIYRPQVKRNAPNDPRSAPKRVSNLKDVKSSEQRIKEAPNQKTNQQQRNAQPDKQQQQQQQRNAQPAKQQQQQRNAQPDKQQQQQQQRNAQPAKQQQQQQRNVQPAQQQQQQQQQQKQQQQQQQQRNAQPAKQQQPQQQRNVQPAQQQQQQQQQRNAQPAKQQQPQQQRNVQPAQQQQQQQRNNEPSQPQQNKKEEKRTN